MSEVIVVGEIRMSYVTLFTPRSTNGGDPKFSLTLLIPKSNTTALQAIQGAIEKAKQEGVQKAFGGSLPNFVASPLHDGDGNKTTGEPYGPECKGHFVMTASTQPDRPPMVVAGNDRHPVIDQSEVYSGCHGYVSMHFFAYNSHGRKGIGCSLDNVWKTRDDEPLGAVRTTAEDDFGGIAAPAAQQGYQQTAPQQGYQAPQQGYQAPQQYQQQPQTGYDPYQADTPMPPQLGGQPQQQTPQYQQPAPQQNYQQPVQQQPQQRLDPITGQPIGGVYGV